MAIFKEFMHWVKKPSHSQIFLLFQFAGEISNSHMYKFLQNNLFSSNMIADSLRKFHISENRENKCSTIDITGVN